MVGDGFSLQQWDVGSDPAEAASWRLSSFENGSPGVLPAADPLTFEAWWEASFSAEQIGDPEVSGMFADPDRDGRVNLIEFGFAGHPWEPESGPLVRVAVEAIEVDGAERRYLTLTFDRREAVDLGFALQVSAGLGDWETLPLFRVRGNIDAGTGIETLTVRAKEPVAEAVDGMAVRIRVSR